MQELSKIIEKYLDRVVEYRRHLHQNPELSHQEKNTADYVVSQLKAMGLTPQTNVGGYGVVALIEGKSAGKCVALRADFDALPVKELTGLPFTSKNE